MRNCANGATSRTSLSARERRCRLWSAGSAVGWLAARSGAPGLRPLGLRLSACGGARGYRLLNIGCCHPERGISYPGLVAIGPSLAALAQDDKRGLADG